MIMGEKFPKKVILDFEIAVWKALKTVFPETKLQGCLFHFKQAIYRKIQVVFLIIFSDNNLLVNEMNFISEIWLYK